MPNLSKPFIERPKATILLVAGFFALGLLAYFQLPISSLPDVDFPTINVSATTGSGQCAKRHIDDLDE